MVRKRTPNRVEERKTLTETETKFVGKVDNPQFLDDLELDELADRFDQIEQQGQLMQGQILLAARKKFESDTLFGQWAGRTLCSCSPQHRTRLMNLARFFEGRPLDKISITAAYEISAPINADIALEIYEYTRGKNMAVSDVKTLIAKKKGESLPIPENNPVRIIPTDKPLITGKPLDDDEIIEKAVEIMEESVKTETTKIEADLESLIMAIVECENPQIAIVALKNVIDKINAKRYGK